MSSVSVLLEPATAALLKIHRAQVHREPWPDFSAYTPVAHPAALRRAAAVQWAGRARAEHGSIHQFSALSHALCEARMPVSVLGALGRLITDEVRHAELCGEAARTLYPEGLAGEPAIFAWPVPRAPWGPPPAPDPAGPLLAWAAGAVLTACCFGETLSRPMLEAIAVRATEPLAEAIARQILRDEQLHARFGWEMLTVLLPRLSAAERAQVETLLPGLFADFARSTCGGIGVAELAGTSITIARGTEPNLGTLTAHEYAAIFYATVEAEIIPGLERLGLSGQAAWAARPAP
jgi:hypothetical protein